MTRIVAALALAALLAPVPAHACAECESHAAHAPPRPERERYLRATRAVRLPGVTLLDQDGRAVPLAEILAPGAPVALNFVYTTCTTICPVMSASFAALGASAAELRGLRRVSISIDPEQDRPAVLAAYALRFGAGPSWRFYTGSAADVRAVLDAFGAFNGDKSNHRPLTYLRTAAGGDWIRIEGLATGDDLARELRELRAAR